MQKIKVFRSEMFKYKKKDKRCIFVFIAVYYLNGMYTNCIYAKFDTITEHLTYVLRYQRCHQ